MIPSKVVYMHNYYANHLEYPMHEVCKVQMYTLMLLLCSISSNRKFGDEGTRHLAAALKNNKHVTILACVTIATV